MWCRLFAVVSPEGTVRQATAADLEAVLDQLIRHLAARFHGGALVDAERRSLLNDLNDRIEGGERLVLERQGKVAGCIVIKPRHFFGRDFIELLFVSPEARRSGVGRLLMERAVMRNHATAVVFTSTNRSNNPMRALLESGGWLFSGQLEGLDEGDPELFYFFLRK